VDLPSNGSNYDPGAPVSPSELSHQDSAASPSGTSRYDSAPASPAGFLPHSGLVGSMPELVSDSKELMSLDDTPGASVRHVSPFEGSDGFRLGGTRNDVDQVGIR
jgi:hypothetical protein